MATLKISDLSVGDWVMCNENKYRVMGITMFHELDLLKSSEGFRTSIDNIESIPITAEVLVKNGFERPDKKVYMDTWSWTNGEDTMIEVSMPKGKFYIRVARIEDGITRDRDCNFGFNYIHQLQHALRLAGVDKEINL